MNLPTILNVALGLVVLYFLLSTVASLIIELLTTWARYREEILYVTVNRLLAGEPDTPWDLLQLVWDRMVLRLAKLPWLASLAKLTKPYEIAAPGPKSGYQEDDVVKLFWSHPKIRSLAAPGVDSPPAIEPATFADVLLDLVVPRDPQGALPDNPMALKRALAVPDPVTPERLRETLRTLGSAGNIPVSATGEAMWGPYRASIATWFEEAAKRSTEKYRQSIQYMLLCTGFIIAALLNADSIRTIQLLSHDRSLQEATASFAATMVQPKAEAPAVPQPVSHVAEGSAKRMEELRQGLADDIEKLRQLEAIGFPLGWRGADFGFYNVPALEAAPWVGFWRSELWLFSALLMLKIAGLAATALAIAQGGPFWYDLMNRLIGLRKGQADVAAPGGTAAATSPVGRAGAGAPPDATTSALEIGHDLAAAGSGFDPRKAYWLSQAAMVAYSPPEVVRALVLQKWNFHELNFFSERGTQGFCAWDEQLLLIAFRGTELSDLNDILTDVRCTPVPFEPPGTSTVHQGFQASLKEVDIALGTSLDQWIQLVASSPTRRIILTGHSLGGALATLCFARVAALCPASRPLLYTFGCPKVGNRYFSQELDRKYPGQIFRIVHESDIVPTLPPRDDYAHAGLGIHFEPGGGLRKEISGLGRLLGIAAAAAVDMRKAAQKTVEDHSMEHYVRRAELLVRPQPTAVVAATVVNAPAGAAPSAG